MYFIFAVGDQPRAIVSWVSNTDRASYYSLSVAGHTFYRLNYPLRLNKYVKTLLRWIYDKVLHGNFVQLTQIYYSILLVYWNASLSKVNKPDLNKKNRLFWNRRSCIRQNYLDSSICQSDPHMFTCNRVYNANARSTTFDILSVA